METSTILQILDNQPEAYFQLHYDGYAEPGYDDPKSGLIATGNWNPSQRLERVWPVDTPDWLKFSNQEGKDKLQRVEDYTMSRIGVILGKLGTVLEWEDEWCACSECNKLVRTEPDSYSWTRSYWLQDGIGLYCQDCVKDDPEDYLEYLEGNSNAANTLDLNLEEQGYQKIDEEYENGLYGGQCDNPHKIAESLGKLGINRFIFDIDGVNQFDTSFSVWVHKSEYHKFDPDKIESKGPDPAHAMRDALAGGKM